MSGSPVIALEEVSKSFPVRGGWPWQRARALRAVERVSFSVEPGETLALVGESGCGKSTVGRLILRLTDPTSGALWLKGQRIDGLRGAPLRALRKHVQVVFQDPFSSLNPRLRVREMLAEPIGNFGETRSSAQIDRAVADLLEAVRLPRDAMRRYPHEFSGGQRQRIGIARALATQPDLIVCDEAVSALDVSVKAQIVNLLGDLQRERGLALLFISHDLAIVEYLAQRVAVMYLGRVVEIGPRAQIFEHPAHPYTRALLSAVPVPDPSVQRERVVPIGEVPSPIDPPSGCHFHPRCPHARATCREQTPALRALGPGHAAACHLLDETGGADRESEPERP